MSSDSSTLHPRIINTGRLTRSDGSIEIKIGNSSVICTITGPIPAELARSNPQRAVVECNVKVPKPISTTDTEHVIEDYLNKVLVETAQSTLALDLYPKMKFSISLQVVHDDGSLLSLCMNALSLVLIQAGSPCRHSFTAISACQIVDDTGARFVFHPTKADEEVSRCDITLALASPHHQIDITSKGSDAVVTSTPVDIDEDDAEILFMDVKGSWPVDDLFNAISKCKHLCLEGARKLRQSVE